MLEYINNKNPNIRRKLLGRFTTNINPNIITVLALIVAFAAGASFYYMILPLAVFLVLLNGFLDILDGETAKMYNRKTKIGDFLDHTADRLADIVIILGITLSSYIPNIYGYGLIIATLLVSYLGTQAQALTGKRFYGGLVGRADRLILISVFGIAEIFYSGALYYGVLILLVLTVVTFFQRFYNILKTLK